MGLTARDRDQAVLHGVDEHVDPGSDERGARRVGYGFLRLGKIAQAFAHDGFVDHTIEIGGHSAVFAGKGKESSPIELRRVEEGDEFVVVGLGLALEAADER